MYSLECIFRQLQTPCGGVQRVLACAQSWWMCCGDSTQSGSSSLPLSACSAASCWPHQASRRMWRNGSAELTSAIVGNVATAWLHGAGPVLARMARSTLRGKLMGKGSLLGNRLQCTCTLTAQIPLHLLGMLALGTPYRYPCTHERRNVALVPQVPLLRVASVLTSNIDYVYLDVVQWHTRQ